MDFHRFKDMDLVEQVHIFGLTNIHPYCDMYIPLSDDKHQMVRDSSKKRTGQHGRNSNPVVAAVVFRVQPFNGSNVSLIRLFSLMLNYAKPRFSFLGITV